MVQPASVRWATSPVSPTAYATWAPAVTPRQATGTSDGSAVHAAARYSTMLPTPATPPTAMTTSGVVTIENSDVPTPVAMRVTETPSQCSATPLAHEIQTSLLRWP